MDGDEPDVRRDRLSSAALDPDGVDDPVHIDHEIETEDLRPAGTPSEPPAALRVLSWNLERGFELDRQIEVLLALDGGPPDVVLLQEADRGLERTSFRHVTREIAAALGAAYVFATEFVELPAVRDGGPLPPEATGEHGNAVVSRLGLRDPASLRFAAQRSWYQPPDVVDPVEPRVGGRVAVAATVDTAAGPVRVASVHLESEITALDVQAAQAAEAAAWVIRAGLPCVVAGDLNCYWAYYDWRDGNDDDRTLRAFLDAGYADAHEGLALEQRPTVREHDLDAAIDLLLVRGLEHSAPWVGSRDEFRPLSDHQPVAATVHP